MTVFTVTEKETYDRCEWRWDFNSFNQLGIEPILPLRALFIGTLVHKALDVLASTLLIKEPHSFSSNNHQCNHVNSDGSVCNLSIYAHAQDTAIYNVYAYQKLNEVYTRYEQQVGVSPGPQERAALQSDVNLGAAMFSNYLTYYKKPLPDNLIYIATEQSLTVDIPDTEHCACTTNKACTCTTQCRPFSMPVHYTYCMCQGFQCSCRQLHKLEATIDGLIQDRHDGRLGILENKTFTYHPTRVNDTYPEFQRNHQFMGYVWAARQASLPVLSIFYNGLWKRSTVPDKKSWDDMFLRTTLRYQTYELEEWGRQFASAALKMGDPNKPALTRNVPAVGGCKGLLQCNFLELCDARFKNINYQTLLKTKYTKRERTSIFEDTEN